MCEVAHLAVTTDVYIYLSPFFCNKLGEQMWTRFSV